MSEERRMQLRGLHHVTGICRDLEATIASATSSASGSSMTARATTTPARATCGSARPAARAGTLLSFMEYPQLPTGVVGVGSTHHFALVVESAEELEAWRDYLRGKEVECTDLYDQGRSSPVYLRDPDGHVVEIATRGPGFAPGPR